MNNLRFSKEETEKVINKLYTEKGIKVIEYNDDHLYDRINKIVDELYEEVKDLGLDKMDILYNKITKRVRPMLLKEYPGVSLLCEISTGQILLFQKYNDTSVNSNRLS